MTSFGRLSYRRRVAGSFTLHDRPDFGGRSFTFRLDDHPENGISTLDGFRLRRGASSVSWVLPKNTLVALHEHRDGTGRTFALRPGAGSLGRLADVGLEGAVAAWRWTDAAAPRPVTHAFEWIPAAPVVAAFDHGGARLVGGHLQGLGVVDERTVLVSASGDREAKLFVVEWPRVVAEGRGQVVAEHVVGDHPLTHAGGLQIASGIAAVGVEDDDAQDSSTVRFFDLADPRQLIPIEHLELQRPAAGQPPRRRRWTAGAVGLTRVHERHLLVVGSWDSADLDVYRSTRSDLRDPACRFRFVADWSRSGADTNTWIDDNWSKYQSLNLLAEADRVFLVGGSNGPRESEWIDLFELDIEQDRRQRIRKIAKRRLIGRDGASFRWAGGISAGAASLHAFSVSRDFDELPVINAYPGPESVIDREHATSYLANTRTREVHSLVDPCRWTGRVQVQNRRQVDVLPDGYRWCEHCFPGAADA